MLLLLFFLSGISGLVYQVLWVREFGAVFGATVHTTSLVVAIFMLGLGTGSYLVGRWADARYERAPESLLRAYGIFELIIATLGLAISTFLPHLQEFAAKYSSYVADSRGWFALSPLTYVAHGAIALVVLGPITMLMGGTLTLLIRHRVRADVEDAGSWKIAALYGVNTIGAAAGAFLTDFALVPAVGMHSTQLFAVVLNIAAGVGAIALSLRTPVVSGFSRTKTTAAKGPPKGGHYMTVGRGQDMPEHGQEVVAWTALALLLSGFAGMGMEIVWLRHFGILLGGFRAVFSLVTTIMLAGIGAGALIGGALDRRTSQPAQLLMAVQGLLVVSLLLGLASNSVATLDAQRHAAEITMAGLAPLSQRLVEFWYNARPMLIEVGLPSILMGATFPLGNAVIQHAERAVGRRAGVLYLANTIGAVCGSLAAGFVLLPRFGMQGTATVLALTAGLTLAPLYLMSSTSAAMRKGSMLITAMCVVVIGVAIDRWLRLPETYVLRRALPAISAPEKLLSIKEGITEAVAVTEMPGRGRGLLTNGHPMSSTALLDQRYMRALVHIPLLSMDAPTHVLVIGFGVGNSTHAATLHPSVERVDVADLSRQILESASFFRDANANVLRDPRVKVFVNDGRQHLQMQAEGTYDLVTLEPPPIAHAGVGALYSREFYELAQTRLKHGGYLSQWLPAYQVPADTALSMVRAFIDVFPQSVLLSGTQGELLLIGTTADAIQIDPERLTRTLEQSPKVLADLRRLDLGTVTEIVGTFVGSAETMTRATRNADAVSDNRPLQEYGVRSVLGSGTNGVPAALFDLSMADKWCPRCFNGEDPTPAAAGLDAYLALLDQAYRARPAAAQAAAGAPRPKILGSAYLGAVLPDTDAVHNITGVILLREKQYAEAADEFRKAIAERAGSADAHRNLGTALAAMGNASEAIEHLQRAIQLAPDNAGAREELATLLRATGSRPKL